MDTRARARTTGAGAGGYLPSHGTRGDLSSPSPPTTPDCKGDAACDEAALQAPCPRVAFHVLAPAAGAGGPLYARLGWSKLEEGTSSTSARSGTRRRGRPRRPRTTPRSASNVLDGPPGMGPARSGGAHCAPSKKLICGWAKEPGAAQRDAAARLQSLVDGRPRPLALNLAHHDAGAAKGPKARVPAVDPIDRKHTVYTTSRARGRRRKAPKNAYRVPRGCAAPDEAAPPPQCKE